MPVGDSPGKLTKDAKAMIQLAFEDLGGLPRLVEWANDPRNLGIFYTQIWGKIIPRDIKAEVDSNITIEVVKYGEDDYALQHNGNKIIMHQQEQITEAIINSTFEDENEDKASE